MHMRNRYVATAYHHRRRLERPDLKAAAILDHIAYGCVVLMIIGSAVMVHSVIR